MAGHKNSISLLKEHHDKFKNNCTWTDPIYTCSPIGEQVFLCVCTYKDLCTEGNGTSKNAARIVAATEMLEALGVSTTANVDLPSATTCPVESKKPSELSQRTTSSETVQLVEDSKKMPESDWTASCDSEQLANDFLEKFSNSSDLSQFIRYPPSPEDLELCFSDINFGLKSPSAPKSETLYKRLDKDMHPITCFVKVMKEFGTKFYAEQVEVEPEHEGNAYVVLLKIDFCCMVIGGLGKTLTEAVMKACRNALDSFCLYMN